MQQPTGVLDLATRAAARALASWQELTGARPALSPPPAGEEPSLTLDDRRAA